MTAQSAPPTVLAHKTAFISAQTLQLSQPLAPSHTWHRTAANQTESSGTQLSHKNIDDALFRLNHLLSQHAKRVYAPQASRHVAEQIERLLVDSTDRHAAANSQENEGDDTLDSSGDALRFGADLMNDKIISSLPAAWAQVSLTQSKSHPSESQRYQNLASSLSNLSSRRAQARQRVERLRRMKALLQPFDTSQKEIEGGDASAGSAGSAGLQENLVTRNGDIEKELERMRMLLVRVSGRLAQLPPPRRANEDITMSGTDGDYDGADTVIQDLDMLERKKVDLLLDTF